MKEKITEILNDPRIAKYRSLLVPAMSGAICLLLIVLLILPQVNEYFSDSKKIADLNAKINVLQEKANVLASANTEAFKKDIELSLNSLPQEPDIPQGIREILYLLSSNRIQLDGITISNPSSIENQSNFYNIKVETITDVSSLMQFVDQIKQSNRVMQVKELEVNTSRQQGKVQAIVMVSVYYKPLEQKIGGIFDAVVIPSESDRQIIQKLEQSANTSSNNFGNVQVGKEDPFE